MTDEDFTDLVRRFHNILHDEAGRGMAMWIEARNRLACELYFELAGRYGEVVKDWGALLPEGDALKNVELAIEAHVEVLYGLLTHPEEDRFLWRTAVEIAGGTLRDLLGKVITE